MIIKKIVILLCIFIGMILHEFVYRHKNKKNLSDKMNNSRLNGIIVIWIFKSFYFLSMFNSQFEIHRIKGIDTTISYIMTWNKAMRNPGTKLFLKEASKVNIEDIWIFCLYDFIILIKLKSAT